ncbi:hypothetical protein [Klebsiella pneumoniae IS39]|nr:hypothetical protein [Klebsiella pneumoniae ISC21]CDL63488.1 hypothetical protein [Klebsiella pneumoniae IS39]
MRYDNLLLYCRFFSFYIDEDTRGYQKSAIAKYCHLKRLSL